jgi:hypothetical protein
MKDLIKRAAACGIFARPERDLERDDLFFVQIWDAGFTGIVPADYLVGVVEAAEAK